MSALFGSKPSVPKLPQLDLGQQQQRAIDANTAALPGAENLVSQANQFSRDQITQMLKQVIPNYDQMTSTIGGNIQSELEGKIPKDVQDMLQNNVAARALGGGVGGSGMHGDLLARDLGLTSLDLTSKGLNAAQSWIAEADKLYAPSQIGVGSMFISPEQEYQATNEQNIQQFQRQWMQNQISAAPDPVLRGSLDMFNQFLGSMRGSSSSTAGGTPYSGGSAYGGGGGVGEWGNGSTTAWSGMGDVQGAGFGTGE